MKKQLTAVCLTAAIVLGCAPAMAADNDIEAALVSAKSRIDIPQELTEFESRTSSDADGTSYSFEWSDPDTSAELSVDADADGHITRYYRYASEFYSDRSFIYKPRDEYYKAAESFLKKAAPELFGTDDCLVYIENDRAISENFAQFKFERRKGGIPVVGNGAVVEVIYSGESFVVSSCYINWDYKTVFIAANDSSMFKPDAYYECFPLELAYRKPIRYYRIANDPEEAVGLVYRFKNNRAGYMSAYTGKVVETEDVSIDNRGFAAAYGAATEETAAAKLSPAERAEIDNVAGLKTADEIIDSVKAMGVFGNIPSAEGFVKRIYKQKDNYIVGLEYSNYSDVTKKTDEPASIYISADGMTGELLSLSSYYYRDNYDKTFDDDQYKTGAEAAEAFLKAEFGDKLSACGEPADENGSELTRRYTRLVNGVKYDNNYLYVAYDVNTGIITGFDQAWDKDVSGFTDPAKAIGSAAALEKMEELAPVHMVYLKRGDKFTLCYTSDGSDIEIDALTGEKIKPIYGGSDPKEYIYNDISGHWAEDMIKAIAQVGAGLPGAEFKPDTEITQEELLRMLTTGMYYMSEEADDLYRNAQDIIPESERAPGEPVLREDAFMYITRLMGFGKLATMDIFAPGFNDGTDVSPEKTGALAILRGYGIVKGDAGSVRPKDKLTRAEAAALMYGYLTTEK